MTTTAPPSHVTSALVAGTALVPAAYPTIRTSEPA